MANEIPSVYIQVIADTGEVQRNLSKAEKAFLGYQNRTKRTGGLSKSITKEFAKMAGGIFAVGTAMSGLTAIAKTMFKDVSDFQVMSVELKVATGSAMAAEEAFSMLQGTAKMLPSSLKDLTTGFVRLKNMGLDASQSSLVSFSNTAAAMGKSLKQFVEAVADANTREFERLKEFGILARNEGEKIRFVFRGVTTEVDNSSADIVKFLTDIGHTEFAGAATEQIDTLATRFTKLQDSIFNLNIAFGEGATGVLGDFVKYLTEKADAAAASKGLSEIKDRLVDIGEQQILINERTNQAQIVTPRTKKLAEDLVSAFSDLGSKELPSAKALIEEMEVSMGRQSEAVAKDTQERIFAIKQGIAISESLIESNKQYNQSVNDGIEATKLLWNQQRLRLQVEESINEAQLDRLLDHAKQEGDLITLKKLKADEAAKLIPIDKTVARLAEEGKASEEQMKKQLAERAAIAKDVASIQSAIAKAAGDEATARMETLKTLKEEREERMKSMNKQMEAVMEVGNAIDYNADRERARNLASRLATSEGIGLAEALEEKYRLVAEKIEDIQGKLAEGGMGAQDIIKANDELDTFQATLDATGKALEDQNKDMTDWAKAMAELFDDVKEGIADAIVEGEGFKGVLTSILKQIAKTQILGAIGGFGTAAKAGTGFLGMLGGKPKGAFTGGPVSSGVTRLVGERGPELFTPSGAGMITPAHRVSGGGGSTVTVVNNFAIDGGDKQEIQGMIAQSVSASVSLAVAKMADNKRRSS
jgi:hypothetical protein